MFNRKNLSSDALWLVEEVVLALKAQGLLVVTDDSFDDIRKRYADPSNQVKVITPDELHTALLELLSDRAKQQ